MSNDVIAAVTPEPPPPPPPFEAPTSAEHVAEVNAAAHEAELPEAIVCDGTGV